MTPHRAGLTGACLLALAIVASGQPAPVATGSTAMVGARVYADPAAIPVDDAVVVMTGQRITAVGARKEVPVPPGATTIDATGLVVLAGFQNSHVHFTDDARWGERGVAAGRRARSEPAGDGDALRLHDDRRPGLLSRQHQGAAPPCRLRRDRRSAHPHRRGAALSARRRPLLRARRRLPADVVATLPQPATPAAAAQLVRAQLRGRHRRGEALRRRLGRARPRAADARRHRRGGDGRGARSWAVRCSRTRRTWRDWRSRSAPA